MDKPILISAGCNFFNFDCTLCLDIYTYPITQTQSTEKQLTWSAETLNSRIKSSIFDSPSCKTTTVFIQFSLFPATKKNQFWIKKNKRKKIEKIEMCGKRWKIPSKKGKENNKGEGNLLNQIKLSRERGKSKIDHVRVKIREEKIFYEGKTLFSDFPLSFVKVSFKKKKKKLRNFLGRS